MGLTISTGVRNAMGSALMELVNAGGTIQIYTGSQPQNPDYEETGTLLATFTLPVPVLDGFGGLRSGNAIFEDVDPTVAVADGVAGWFRMANIDEDNQGPRWMDGDVGDTDSDAVLKLTDVNLVTGGDVTIDSGSIMLPSGEVSL